MVTVLAGELAMDKRVTRRGKVYTIEMENNQFISAQFSARERDECEKGSVYSTHDEWRAIGNTENQQNV